MEPLRRLVPAVDRSTPEECEEDLVLYDLVELAALLRLPLLRDLAALLPRLLLVREPPLLDLPNAEIANRRPQRTMIVLFWSLMSEIIRGILAAEKTKGTTRSYPSPSHPFTAAGLVPHAAIHTSFRAGWYWVANRSAWNLLSALLLPRNPTAIRPSSANSTT
jgi:hypothetical protein